MVETIFRDGQQDPVIHKQEKPAVHSMARADAHGVLLAGGHGWGEWVVEQVCPRPLLPVAGRPLAGYLLEWLHLNGVLKASICTNSNSGLFRRSLTSGGCNGAPLSLAYCEDAMPRGPAGCVYDVAAGSPDIDLFLIVEASTLMGVDLAAVIHNHRLTGAALTVVVEDDESRASLPGRRRRPVGIYVASREAVEQISPRGYQDIKETWIPRLYARNKSVLMFMAGEAQSLRVVDNDSYFAANRQVIEALLNGDPERSYRRIGDALVHESASVAASACIVGPVMIGPGCRIGDEVTLVGPTVVGQACQVGRGAVISRSVLWPVCQVGRNAVLDHAILLNSAGVEPELVVRESVLGSVDAATLSFRNGQAVYWRTNRSPASCSRPEPQ